MSVATCDVYHCGDPGLLLNAVDACSLLDSEALHVFFNIFSLVIEAHHLIS